MARLREPVPSPDERFALFDYETWARADDPPLTEIQMRIRYYGTPAWQRWHAFRKRPGQLGPHVDELDPPDRGWPRTPGPNRTLPAAD